MKFSILIYEAPEQFARRNDPDDAPAYWAMWSAYSKAVADAGVMVGGAGLEPPDAATSLRLRDGKRHVQDGPYADTHEQLGGFYMIDVPDLDAALEWAARCPASSTGTVEVRPHMQMSDDA